ncbi:hypothetical protein ABPG75_005047 [Micractinium tetrahymenae]
MSAQVASLPTDHEEAAAEGPAAATAAVPNGDAAANETAALQERLGMYFSGALTSNLIYLGDRLGLYAALKAHGPCTAAQLADATGNEAGERYIEEWCRQQAAARIIQTDEAAEKFWLTPAQQECLVNEIGDDASPNFFVGGFTAVPGLARTADERLPGLFKSGGGISYDEVEHGVTCGVCRELGVWVRHALVPNLRALPGMEEKLKKGCMVADVGCGCGKALMVVAKEFPASTFHGYDIAEDALKHAREEAKRRGIPNAQFFNPGLDDEKLPQEGTFELVMTHDAIHDIAHPQAVMKSVRGAMKPGGVWVIGDMSALDSHAANVHSHPLATFLYGFSVHLCLPSGLSAPGGQGLGTLGIPAGEMCRMLREAGFASAEVLEDWKHPLNRYYIARA